VKQFTHLVYTHGLVGCHPRSPANPEVSCVRMCCGLKGFCSVADEVNHRAAVANGDLERARSEDRKAAIRKA